MAPHLNVSYRGEDVKTTGYYAPQAAQRATRQAMAAWARLQQRLESSPISTKSQILQEVREVLDEPKSTPATRFATAFG
jgi:hypothetical protein